MPFAVDVLVLAAGGTSAGYASPVASIRGAEYSQSQSTGTGEPLVGPLKDIRAKLFAFFKKKENEIS